MWRLAAILLLVLGLPACDRSAAKPDKAEDLETVDIGGGFDAELTTEFDEKAKAVKIDLGGVLPSDFPPEMPVFSPASVVDFGPGFVELDTPVASSEAQSTLGAQIQRSGWTVDSIGDGASVYSRGSQRVRIVLTAAGSGTRIRYEY